MYLQRKFEQKAGQLYGQRKIRGFCHLYIGQEAVSAGTVSALNDNDPIITAYRDHGFALARGMDPNALMAELFGKETGSSKGKGGSMHFFGKEEHFYGGHGIVGGQIPLGAGIAFADRYNKNGRVTVCLFGDGAARQGSLHETFNMAMTWKLPVIFVCENNKYAMGTSVERTSNIKDIHKLGEGYGMPNAAVDGMEPEPVHESIAEAAERARNGDGPTLLEMKTYRYKGHSMSDPAKYRTKDELKTYQDDDPIKHVLTKIKDEKWLTDEEIEEINEGVKDTVGEAVQFAEDSPLPDVEELYNDVYQQKDYPFITY